MPKQKVLIWTGEETMDQAQFLDAFKKVMEAINLKEKKLSDAIDEMRSTFTALQANLKTGNASDFLNLKNQLIAMLTRYIEQMKSADTSQNEKIDKINRSVKDLADNIRDDRERIIEETLLRLPEQIELDTPEKVRDKLESIKQENQKLNIDAIRDLRNELDRLEKKIRTAKGFTLFGGVGSGGHAVKSYDLSSRLNGVLTTFSLPGFWRVIDVKLSSIPTLRLTTDYTVDGSAHTITFTSEIAASTDLASGQSCIVIYSE